jgi:predicted nuclease of predicted toxin-antitoxin system
MDVHVPGPVTEGLRIRGIAVLTAQEDGQGRTADPELMDRATALGNALVSQDPDLLAEARMRQQTGQAFSGLIYVRQQTLSYGKFIADLELMGACLDSAEMQNQVQFLPLR